MIEWGAAIATLLGLIAWGLKQWQAAQPKRTEVRRDEAIQQGRADIADGNVPAIEQRIDELLTDTDHRTAGEPSAEDIQGRISRL